MSILTREMLQKTCFSTSLLKYLRPCSFLLAFAMFLLNLCFGFSEVLKDLLRIGAVWLHSREQWSWEQLQTKGSSFCLLRMIDQSFDIAWCVVFLIYVYLVYTLWCRSCKLLCIHLLNTSTEMYIQASII